MSNDRFIALITAAMRIRVERAIGGALPGAAVRVGPPRALADSAEAGVYLYRVSPNLHARDDRLPTRGSDGALTASPQLAIDLNYLLWFSSGEPFASEIMLMRVASTLHGSPVIQAEELAIAAAEAGLPAGPTDFDDGRQSLALQPEWPSTDESLRLWASFELPIAPFLMYRVPVLLPGIAASGPLPGPKVADRE
jgi:hypothetical protein